MKVARQPNPLGRQKALAIYRPCVPQGVSRTASKRLMAPRRIWYRAFGKPAPVKTFGFELMRSSKSGHFFLSFHSEP